MIKAVKAVVVDVTEAISRVYLIKNKREKRRRKEEV